MIIFDFLLFYRRSRMRVRGAGAVSLTWPHFGATVALTAGSGPTPAHSAGPDLHRSVSPYDLRRSFSPYDLHRSFSLYDLHRSFSPYDLHRSFSPYDLLRSFSLLFDLHRSFSL
jgi:hypothetical protein